MALSINFILFGSADDFLSYVEKAIAETKTKMGTQMRIIDEVKRKHGSMNNGSKEFRQSQRIDIAGFKVLIDPSVEHELRLMEETFSALQDKLVVFEKTKELFPQAKSSSKVGLVLEDGLPSGFTFYTDNQ